MVLTVIISSLTLLLIPTSLIFFPSVSLKIKSHHIKLETYYLVALLGVLILLFCHLVPIQQIKELFFSSTELNPLTIIILFFSMTFISVVLDELHFFEYLATIVTKHSKGSQMKLYSLLFILISLLTIFTSNDIVILTFTPFILYFTKRTKINPWPYLFSEFIAANTSSLLFTIGNPTNIFLSSAFSIDFFSYFKVMWLPTLVASIISFFLIFLVFHKSLKLPFQDSETDTIVLQNKPLTFVTLGILFTTIILMSISSFFKFPMWLISFIMSFSLFLFIFINSLLKRAPESLVQGSLKRLPYTLIFFLIPMIIIIYTLKEQNVLSYLTSFISSTLAKGPLSTIFTYGLLGEFSSSIINNIPMTILFSHLIDPSSPYLTQAIYSTIISSNLAAYLTPLGALAGIMWLTLIRDSGLKCSYLKFIVYLAPISFITLLATLLTLFFIL